MLGLHADKFNKTFLVTSYTCLLDMAQLSKRMLASAGPRCNLWEYSSSLQGSAQMLALRGRN